MDRNGTLKVENLLFNVPFLLLGSVSARRHHHFWHPLQMAVWQTK